MSRQIFKPYDYQRRAIQWIMDHPRCGLFMEMGLGKTLCSLTAVQDLMDGLLVGRVLVVAPKKVAESTWTDEAAAWSHLDLTVVPVMGTARQREAALGRPADIYVMGCDNTAWLTDLKQRPRFDMIIIDELTKFKSSSSQRFKAMKKLTREAVRVVGLTGTPAPNGLLDLWAQVYCLDGGQRLGPFITRYRDRFFNSVIHNNIPIKTWPKPGAQEAITDLISDICFTMKAADYLELPALTVHDVTVSLPAKTAEAYRKFERDRVAIFKSEAGGGTVTAQSAAALINKLAQYANGCVYDETGGEVEIHGEKIAMLYELVERAGSPVLCFYAYRHDLRRILAAAPRGMKVRPYEGADDLRDWNAGKIDLLLAHPASTAYGLNMQRGGHVIIWFSTGWNLELYQQANARLHRQGQKLPVSVYKLITAGTVDERMAAAIEGKSEAQDSVVRRLAMELSK